MAFIMVKVTIMFAFDCEHWLLCMSILDQLLQYDKVDIIIIIAVIS